MANKNCYTFPELLAIVATICLLLLATSAYIFPIPARADAETTIGDLHVLAQLARIEALNRGRECLFEIDTATHTARVYDGLATLNRADDRQLYEITLPATLQIGDAAGDFAQRIQVIFHAHGGVHTPSLITVNGRAARGQIEIDQAGNIRIDRS